MIFAGRRIVMIKLIQIQIVYAEPEKFWQQEMQMPAGTTVQQALDKLDPNQFPAHMQITQTRLAVYGQLVKPGELLHEHDRIEILKPLLCDPKEIRRQRAQLNPYKKLNKK
jgi:putative ubiquitin-RnfH superfamily antitoxin RatB of RatAB toxin-antitoxin module